MARTTVADCIEHTPNHFELVLGVITRAKALNNGIASEIMNNGDNSIVIALREISEQKITVDLDADIRKSLADAEQIVSGETSIVPEALSEPTPDSTD